MLACVMGDYVWSGVYEFRQDRRVYSVWCEFVNTCNIKRVELREAGRTLGRVENLNSCSFNQWVYLFSPEAFKQATEGAGRDFGPYVTNSRLEQNGNSYVLTITTLNVLAAATGGGLTVQGTKTHRIEFIGT